MPVRVLNESRGTILADRAEDAASFVARFIGLMGRQRLQVGQGLHLAPCSSIHMLFMRFAIDAIFLDREGRVVRVCDSLPPWSMGARAPGAWSVLELPAGVARASRTSTGDQLRFEAC
jgi:uncharacterized protein